MATRKSRGWVDVHHHILPPDYVAAVGSEAIGSPAGLPDAPRWSVASSLEAMDKSGVATAITSITAPGLLLPGEASPGGPRIQRLARECNQFAKRMAADHPGRFGTFAALPLPGIDASLAEIAFSFDQLKAEGIVLYTNYGNRYLGDPLFAPLFDELELRKAIVFVHPTACDCMAGINTGVPTASIEFPHETTRAAVSLWTSGTFSRCPGVRFIFPHGGGTLPYIAARVARLNPKLAESLPLLKRQYYDVALSTYPQVLAALTRFAGLSQILFGTDYPFAPGNTMEVTAQELAALNLGGRALEAIGKENALRLFPGLGNAH